MTVRANDIYDTCTGAMAADFSAGESGLDMSSDSVVEGEFWYPEAGSNRAWISVTPYTITRAPEVYNLGVWGREMEFTVSVWAPSVDTNADRRLQASELAHDVAGALEDLLYDSAVGTLRTYNAIDLRVDIAVFDGLEQGMVGGYGRIDMPVRIVYQKDRGF